MEVNEAKGLPDGWSVVPASNPAPEPAKGHDFKILGVNIHVPAEDKPRPDSNMVGWGENGAGIAPEDALMVGQAGKRIVSAAPGLASKAAATVAEVAPIVKYEALKTALRATGMPESAASVIAAATVGYRGKGKAAAAEAAPAEGAHLDRSVPVQAGSLTPEQLAQRVRFGTGTPPAAAGRGRPGAAPVPTSALPVVEPAPASPAAAAVAPEAEAVTVSKPKMSAVEAKEYLKLRANGKTDAQAKAVLESSRALQEMLGTPAPTAAETRFPKGMRGGQP